MGFLRRLLKTPDEDEDEGQDEFAAEENGLLMVPPLPGDREEPATAEGAANESQLPATATEPAGDVAAQPAADGADPLAIAGASSAVQDQPEPIPGQEPQAEQGSSNEAMDLFRTAAVRENVLSPALTKGIEEVSVTELLSEARSILDGLSGGRGGAGEGRQEAA